MDAVSMTRAEAKFAVERALIGRNLTARMSAADQHYFCAQMNSQLRFPGSVEARIDIGAWTEMWQSKSFPKA
jgi:hypothetical protein